MAIEFADSNVWLYALVAGKDAGKEQIAKNLIASKRLLASVQVINEVCVNLIKKYKFNETEIEKLIRSFYGKRGKFVAFFWCETPPIFRARKI